MNTLRTPLALALLAAFTQLASAQDAPLRQIGTVIIEGSRPTSLPTQIPTTFEASRTPISSAASTPPMPKMR